MTDLNKIYKRFPTQKKCIGFLESILWETGPICPYCNSSNFSPVKNELRYHCNTCNTSFSVTVGTLFHKTKCDLQKWFYLILVFNNAVNPPSVRDLGKEMNVTKDTALKMMNKIKADFNSDRTVINKIIKSLINE